MRRLPLSPRAAAITVACACALGLAAVAAAAGPVFVVVSNDPVDSSPAQFNGAASVGDAGLAQQLDEFLSAQGSPMAGSGSSFVAAGRSVGIDPRYLVALSGAESSFGRNLFRPFNPFGWGYATFRSWAEAIQTVANGLQTGYLSEGRTSVFTIAAKYSPVGASNDPYHTNGQEPYNVARFLQQLGGNPNDIRSGAGVAVSPQGAGLQTVWGNSLGAQAVSLALGFVGVPYVWGGASPSGFDCSGLAMYVYGLVGVTLPHYTGDQFKLGRRVEVNELQAGDLLFFDAHANGDPGHEGIYIGNGLFVQAPHTGDIVRVSHLDSRRMAGYMGAMRPY